MLKTARSPLSLYEATHFSFSSETPGFKRKSSLSFIVFSSHLPAKHQQPLCKQKIFQDITWPSEDAHLTIDMFTYKIYSVISTRVHVSYVANVLKMFTSVFSFATENLAVKVQRFYMLNIYLFIFHLLGIVYYTFHRSSKRTPIIFICLTMSHLNLIL